MATQKYWDGTQWVEIGLSSAAQEQITNIQSQVGSNNDPSSANGSVHAKLKDIKSALGDSFVPFVAAGGVTSFTDVVNITGSGVLKHAISQFGANFLEIYVDGTLVFKAHPTENSNYVAGIAHTSLVDGVTVIASNNSSKVLAKTFTGSEVVNYPYTGGMNGAITFTTEGIRFNSSLRVRTYSSYLVIAEIV